MVVRHNSIIMRSIHQNVLMWVENVPKFLIDFTDVRIHSDRHITTLPPILTPSPSLLFLRLFEQKPNMRPDFGLFQIPFAVDYAPRVLEGEPTVLANVFPPGSPGCPVNREAFCHRNAREIMENIHVTAMMTFMSRWSGRLLAQLLERTDY